MKARLFGKKYNKGVVTLEILIAFAVVILCISGAIIVIFGNQLISVDSQINNEAIYKAQKMLEDLRALSRFDFALVNPNNSTETTGGLTFTKKVDVRQVDLFTKQATSTVTWNSGGRTLSVYQSTLLTNLDITGSTCSSLVSGNWKSPTITSYEFGKDLLGDPSSGYPITAINVYKSKLFVSVNNSNGNNLPTFFIFSLVNPNIPSYSTSMDNDPTAKTGFNAIAGTDSYAYGANAKQSNFGSCSAPTCGQLQIVDISVTPPVLKSTIKMTGVTGTAGQSIGQSIAYRKDTSTGKEYIYLGLTKTVSGPEFNIIDVTDKVNPIWKGGYSVGNTVNSIYIKGNYAYIATPNTENLTIINISTPSNPTRVGGYAPTGGSNGESVYVVGNSVYLGRTFGTNEFYILNASTPSNPSLTAQKNIGSGSLTSINSIFVRDYLAFMITGAKFEVWNISDPSSIVPWTPSGTVAEFQDLPGGTGTAMDCENNYIYVGSVPSNDKGYVSIITSG